ncbi:glycoside hydrolase family 15 protein, partial [Candidatus Woesearchaeota archaeon]
MGEGMLDYGIIGNCKTCALVKSDASIDWFCFPTFSSPSVFARLLDTERGGTLRITPVGNYACKQRYLPNTAILETTFTRRTDAFRIIDFFPRYRHHRLVRQNKLFRIIIPLKGTPRFRLTYDPRPGYAKRKARSQWRDGVYHTVAGEHEITLKTNLSQAAIAGEECVLRSTKFLVCGAADDTHYSVRRCMQLLDATQRYWERWVETLITPQQHRPLIIRSAITLKLLTYSNTGAILAAATTSIPEVVGTSRTFDYRHCWVRDAAFAVDALKKIGREYEPKKLIAFIMKLAMENDHVQILYGIEGETRLRERSLGHLAGFKGSRPVRIGNAAYNQEQHDIYGELIDILYLYYAYYAYETMGRKQWRFLSWLVNQIKAKWERKDSGIWEFRGKHRHYLFSKLMCWVGVDRAVKLAQHYGKD